MAKNPNKYYQRKIHTSYVTSVISITLVLFIIGLLGLVILHAKNLSDYVKENIGFSIMIKEDVKEADILAFQKRLDILPYVKSTEYIPKEKAAVILKKELGEDFIGFLGYNPLLTAIDLRLKADYTTVENVVKIEKTLTAFPEVKEVFYQKSLVDLVNRNINKISLVLLGFSLILLVISIALINNTIRLSVYSKRFILRSMQLVGATRGFIRKPFIIKGIVNGVISSVLALGGLMLVVYFAIQQVPELLNIQNMKMYVILVVFILLLGILISWFSTYFAVRKFLRMKTDYLYT